MKPHLTRSHTTWLACAAATAVVLFLPAAQAAPGDLDPAFGSGGKVITDFGASDLGHGIAVQSDGKIVVAGETNPYSDDFALARYDANGSLDPSFGSGGKVQTDFGFDNGEFAYAVAIQNDGKIVAAGGGFSPSTLTDFALARYNADGSLDASFGGGGKIVTHLQRTEYANGVAIQPDGKIVAVGATRQSTSVDGYDFGVVRYNPNGSLDTTFAGSGFVITPFSSIADSASAVVIQPDGKILVVGFGNNAPGTGGFALARYNPDGSLDASFDSDGKVLSDFGAGDGVALQPDGKILVAGAPLRATTRTAALTRASRRMGSSSRRPTTRTRFGFSLTAISSWSAMPTPRRRGRTAISWSSDCDLPAPRIRSLAPPARS